MTVTPSINSLLRESIGAIDICTSLFNSIVVLIYFMKLFASSKRAIKRKIITDGLIIAVKIKAPA